MDKVFTAGGIATSFIETEAVQHLDRAQLSVKQIWDEVGQVFRWIPDRVSGLYQS